MANKFYSAYSQLKTRGGGGGQPARPGHKGAEAKGTPVKEQTAAWPSSLPGPSGPSFNRKTKVSVVKTRAKKLGVD